MSSQLVIQAAVVSTILFAGSALGADLRCVQNQSLCYITTRDFTVGDEIAILNKSNQTVALGVVEAIKGSKRVIKIEKKMGTIHQADRIALVDKDPGAPSTTVSTISPDHETYQKPGDVLVGASGGIATVRSGEGLPAYLFDAYGEWRKWHGVRLIAGGAFLLAKGNATKTDGKDGISTAAMDITGIGVYPGVAYRVFESAAISPKFEADLGAIYISGTVDGTSGDFDRQEYKANMTNGFGLYGRLKGSMQYQMSGGWGVEAGASASQIQQAMSTSLFAGASKTIK